MKVIMCCRCKKKPGRKTKSGKYFCSNDCKKKGEKRKKAKNFARSKGNRGETNLINHLKEIGIFSEKQPLSGSLSKKEFKNDVLIGENVFSTEVKLRKTFTTDYKWIDTCKKNIADVNKHLPAVIKKGNNKLFLIEMYLDDFINFIETCFRDPKIRYRLWKEWEK